MCRIATYLKKMLFDLCRITSNRKIARFNISIMAVLDCIDALSLSLSLSLSADLLSVNLFSGLVSLVRTYVQCVREGNIPCVGEAAMLVADRRNQKLTLEAIESFSAKIKQIQLPVSDLQHLANVLEKYSTEETVTFKDAIIYDEDEKFLCDLKVHRFFFFFFFHYLTV